MTYCPECGCYSPTDEQYCPENCDTIAESLFRSSDGKLGSEKAPKTLPATTANRFCGYCDKVFAPEVETCPGCHKKTSPLTESHLMGDIFLLSGIAAKTIWEHD